MHLGNAERGRVCTSGELRLAVLPMRNVRELREKWRRSSRSSTLMCISPRVSRYTWLCSAVPSAPSMYQSWARCVVPPNAHALCSTPENQHIWRTNWLPQCSEVWRPRSVQVARLPQPGSAATSGSRRDTGLLQRGDLFGGSDKLCVNDIGSVLTALSHRVPGARIRQNQCDNRRSFQQTGPCKTENATPSRLALSVPSKCVALVLPLTCSMSSDASALDSP